MDVENCQCHCKKTNIQHFSMLYTLIDHKNDVKFYGKDHEKLLSNG